MLTSYVYVAIYVGGLKAQLAMGNIAIYVYKRRLCISNQMFNHIANNIPYSLKLSGTKIFVDFVVFKAPTKILSLKISYKFEYKLNSSTNIYCMRFAMAH